MPQPRLVGQSSRLIASQLSPSRAEGLKRIIYLAGLIEPFQTLVARDPKVPVERGRVSLVVMDISRCRTSPGFRCRRVMVPYRQHIRQLSLIQYAEGVAGALILEWSGVSQFTKSPL